MLNLSTLADKKAMVDFTAGSDTGVSGTLSLVQHVPDGPVSLFGSVDGLASGPHGFHVHGVGNLSNDCIAAGGHFNPDSVKYLYLLSHNKNQTKSNLRIYTSRLPMALQQVPFDMSVILVTL